MEKGTTFALVASRQVLRHESVASRESVLRKLLKFHHEHHTTSQQLLPQLETANEQLTQSAREHEGELLSGSGRHCGPSSLAGRTTCCL